MKITNGVVVLEDALRIGSLEGERISYWDIDETRVLIPVLLLQRIYAILEVEGKLHLIKNKVSNEGN